MAKTPRERIGEALYMLAAGADEAVFVKTLQTYVAVHSQTEDQVAELLRSLQQANPVVLAKVLQTLPKAKPAKKPKAKRKRTGTVQKAHQRA